MQLAKISNFQSSFSNIFLIVNTSKKFESGTIIKNKSNKNQIYLNKICEKNNLKINYMNLSEQQNFSKIMEKFINSCLILKKNSLNKTKKNSIKNLHKENLNLNQYNKSEGSSSSSDINLNGSKKSKKENCCIF